MKTFKCTIKEIECQSFIAHLAELQFNLNEFYWQIKPAGIYLLKVNNGNTRTRREICLKLTIKSPDWRQWRLSGVFIVKFEQICSGVFNCWIWKNIYQLGTVRVISCIFFNWVSTNTRLNSHYETWSSYKKKKYKKGIGKLFRRD